MLPQKGETATGNTQRKFEEKKFGRVALRYICTQMTDRQTRSSQYSAALQGQNITERCKPTRPEPHNYFTWLTDPI